MKTDFEKWEQFLNEMDIEFEIDDDEYVKHIRISSKHICDCCDSVVIDFSKENIFKEFQGWGE